VAVTVKGSSRQNEEKPALLERTMKSGKAESCKTSYVSRRCMGRAFLTLAIAGNAGVSEQGDFIWWEVCSELVSASSFPWRQK